MKLKGAALVLALALAGAVAAASQLRPVAGGGAAQFVHVARGTSFNALARELERQGIIRNAAVLSLYARVTGKARGVRAGRYRFAPDRSATSILKSLVTGETHPVRVVFPEGIWLREIASLLSDSLGLQEEEVVAVASDSAWLARHGVDAPDGEGYLFPDTYAFEGDESAPEALLRLISTGRERWSRARENRAKALGMTRHEVMTLASIIEAETARPEERARVSAVYHRRLERGMPLQADPTIVYALGTRGRAPLYADLDLSSPYNTYRRRGLPPGPIGNPGDASIRAALHPDTTCTALFFVARADGSHIFTDTFEEHVAARRGLRR